MASRAKQPPPPQPFLSQEGWRRALLGMLTAVCVARPLLPSEAVAAEGDGATWVMLLLIAAALWLLASGVRMGLRVQLGWPELGLALFLLLHTASSLWSLRFGAPRPALNMLWEWLGLGLVFLLLRQWLQSAVESRALVVVMVALAASLALEGVYQYAVTMPEMRAAYYENQDRAIAAMGLDAPPGSQARWALEQRLNSTEPLATFALTNSLAGFLLPWLVTVLGIVLLGVARVGGRSRWSLLGRLLLVATPLTVCLLMTKSRSAVAALAIGAILLGVVARVRGVQFSWRIVLSILVVGALLVAGMLAGGILDREVFTEAFKSFGYRWQYWQAALQMIADRPLLGWGDGNFQSVYTRYKLPTASEEVADPHSFLLEIAATAGLPALLAFLALVGAACWCAVRGDRRAADEAYANTKATIASLVTEDAQNATFKHVLAGAVVGWCLAFVLGLSGTVGLEAGVFIRGLMSSALVVALLWPWLVGGTLPVVVPLIAALALLVNLLAAGGIGFPGVAGSLWVLLAIALSNDQHGTRDNQAHGGRLLSPRAAWGCLALVTALIAACYFTAYQPVLVARMAMNGARDLRPRTAADQRRVLELLTQASVADPWAMQPRLQLAMQHFADWERSRASSSFAEFEQNAHQALTLSPQSSLLRRELGEQYRRAFSFTQRREHLARAVQLHTTAVELYPNKAAQRAYLAISLEQSGERSAALEQARVAWELDELTPHADQKLPNSLRAELQQSLPKSTESHAAAAATIN